MSGTPSAGFEATVRDGVFRLRRPDTRWLSTGWRGGRSRGDVVYNVSVPEGFDRTDLGAYRDERLARAEFTAGGSDRPDSSKSAAPPTLFTGVSMAHVRGARHGVVVAYATSGLSNPAMLPMQPGEAPDGEDDTDSDRADSDPERADSDRDGPHSGRDSSGPDRTGTVNLIVGTTRRLADGAAANLVAVASEAKATTLLATAGVPGTTSDAVVIGDDPAGESVTFSGSATPVGGSTRICVRDAIRASLRSRYPDGDYPGTAAEAEHGIVADEDAEVFEP